MSQAKTFGSMGNQIKHLLMLGGVLAVAIIAVSGAALADDIVYINAQANACNDCGGDPNTTPLPGTYIGDPGYNPVQLTLGPGTYNITNADPNGTGFGGASYSAWNFNDTTPPSWVWSFIIADDSTKTVLKDDFVHGEEYTQAAMAALTGTTTSDGPTPLSATSTAGFQDTLTLTGTTTLDFFIHDYYWGVYDNLGGVALDISPAGTSPVPEPATMTLLGTGLIGLAGMVRRKLRR